MKKLCFYVPESHLESVKKAVFEAGAGRFDGYSECAWQTLGQGQFRPLPGSQPFIGTMNTLEKVAEYKVEMVCPLDRVREVISALKAAHPYETPAFELYEVQME